MEGTVKCAANQAPLTPITFLLRSAAVYPDSTSVVYASRRFTWRVTLRRCLRIAAAVSRFSLPRLAVVAVLAPNVPEMYELHFAVPMAGAVLCCLNTRHDAAMLSVLLRHSEAKLLFVDAEFLPLAIAAVDLLPHKDRPILILINDPHSGSIGSGAAVAISYDSLLEGGTGNFEIRWPMDECDPIALNYTSGTTSRPKGVVYTHRGTFLNALAAVLLNDMAALPVYLWTVPMFHCNGWCMPWGVAAQGGTNVCLRRVLTAEIFRCIVAHSVTHMGGAPTVLNMIVNSPAGDRKLLPGRVTVMTGGAPPPPNVLSAMESLGFLVVHSYGLTETYGPATVCWWKPEWALLPADEQARLKARQGLNHIGLDEVDVKDPMTMKSVPADGKTTGEVMLRGNTVMAGYFKDPEATREALAGGWFRSGDIGVRQPDGYVQLKDRAKDIIISGGENISTIEVEAAVSSHPAVMEAAVVARPDEHWGETPCAFVKLKDGWLATGKEITEHCFQRLPRYMVPRTIIFMDELPKTSTGKIQKFLLRAKAKAMAAKSKL